MRHRKRGRKLGRNPKHQRAMLRNLASALFLTERDAEFEENAPKVRGRIVTTITKAKEVRPLVERCITIARRSLDAEDRAAEYDTNADRGTDQWKSWRESDQWQNWNKAMAPALHARRRCLRLLGDKQAVKVLFDQIAPRFEDRDGGYTRILRLAKPRLGDSATRAILEFVGVRDRIVERSQRPAFEDEPTADTILDDETGETETDEAAATTADGETAQDHSGDAADSQQTDEADKPQQPDS